MIKTKVIRGDDLEQKIEEFFANGESKGIIHMQMYVDYSTTYTDGVPFIEGVPSFVCIYEDSKLINTLKHR